MKAMIYTKFGSPYGLQLKEVPAPVPKENELLLKVKASSVNAYDWRHIRADPWMIRLMGGGLTKPKHPIMGADVAGIVESIGKNVKSLKPGDEVFGEAGYGGFAEYVAVHESRIVPKPRNRSFEEAAAAPMAALTALQGLRDRGEIEKGYNVLINGSSGGVGSYAVQIARWYGCEVTAVCSTSKMDMLRSIGADRVIDYTKEDVTEIDDKYDLIFDSAAFRPASDYKKILKPDGKYIIAGGNIFRIMNLLIKPSKNMKTVTARILTEDLMLIKEMLENGKVKSVIDNIYPLEQTADAIRRLEERKVIGKVVIKI
ncbi:MAG: NAD(P)-dependent alcohol dehydrogenase [Bacteroidota bacterium]